MNILSTFIGNIGEELVEKHLIKSGYKILKRNYRLKFIEIDILALKNNEIYVFEIKTFSCENLNSNLNETKNVSQRNEKINISERVSKAKIKKMKMFADYYLNENNQYENVNLGIITVCFGNGSKTAKIKIFTDIL